MTTMTDLRAVSGSFPSVAVIGGGPAGLMAAEVISEAGFGVDVYEAMPSVGRKFLIAGKGGLNITHSEPQEQFLSRYGNRRRELEPFLKLFGAPELRQWAAGLGVETFVGTSGRVFPVGMKAATLLYRWRQRLEQARVRFHFRHRWLGWDERGALRFDTPGGAFLARPGAVILALGGASWPQLGSTGAWAEMLAAKGVPLVDFKPANCGFDVPWSEIFREKFDGHPLKSVVVSFTNSAGQEFRRQGEFIVNRDGVEGSLVYALSAFLRDEIALCGSATIFLDLAPDRTLEALAERLSGPRGSRSISSHLEKAAGMRGVKAGLLWEFVPREDFLDPFRLASAIKALPVPLVSARPLKEAISTAGGVRFEALGADLMIHSLPGVFCAGEMLDWEAPTGGYLITACCSTGRAAGQGAVHWLKRMNTDE